MFPNKNIEDIIKSGQEYNWRILSVEPREHRMGLVLAETDKKAKKEKPAKAEKEASTGEEALPETEKKKKIVKKAKKEDKE